jgi:hypothetical protein
MVAQGRGHTFRTLKGGLVCVGDGNTTTSLSDCLLMQMFGDCLTMQP